MMEFVFNLFVVVSFFFIVLYASRLLLGSWFPKKPIQKEQRKCIILQYEELDNGRIVISMSGDVDDIAFLDRIKNKFNANDILIKKGENKK